MRLAEETTSIDSTDALSLHDRHSAYVWIFYSSLVGVEAMGCYCYLASLLEQGVCEVTWEQVTENLGLSNREILVNALCSLVTAGMIELSQGVCLVREKLPSIDPVLESQLPRQLRRIHCEARTLLSSLPPSQNVHRRAVSNVEAMRNRARREAVSLLRLGHSCKETELELSTRGYHPSLVTSSTIWALWHLAATAQDRVSIMSPISSPSPLRLIDSTRSLEVVGQTLPTRSPIDSSVK
ncbi:MAG: hypothetical protein C4317_06455 [Acidimicrobiia bacterium]